jgi:hypothetical protein
MYEQFFYEIHAYQLQQPINLIFTLRVFYYRLLIVIRFQHPMYVELQMQGIKLYIIRLRHSTII